MITLAFAQMLYYFFVSLEAYGGDDGISLFARNTFPGMNLKNPKGIYRAPTSSEEPTIELVHEVY